MRKDLIFHNRTVKLKNTSTLAFLKWQAKRGDWLTWRTNGEAGDPLSFGRMVGTVSTTGTDGERLNNWIVAVAVHPEMNHGGIRFVNPDWVTSCTDVDPLPFLAYLCRPLRELPDAKVMHELSDYGTLSTSYIGNADFNAKAFKQGISPVALRSKLENQPCD